MILSRSWNNRFKIQNRVDGVTKSHPDGFLIEWLLHIEQNTSISHSKSQNHFRGNFSKRTEGKSRSWAVEQNWAVQIWSHRGHLWREITSTVLKVFFKNQRYPIIQVRPSISHQTITHPEECIWAEQTPRRQLRAPDAPKIKHDRMKQFYMVDMGLKTW